MWSGTCPAHYTSLHNAADDNPGTEHYPSAKSANDLFGNEAEGVDVCLKRSKLTTVQLANTGNASRKVWFTVGNAGHEDKGAHAFELKWQVAPYGAPTGD